jgi:hypothetical protein
MANFLDDNLNQTVLLDINYLEVLGENTFEFCLYQLITHQLDLTEFTRRYKNKSVGRKALFYIKRSCFIVTSHILCLLQRYHFKSSD